MRKKIPMAALLAGLALAGCSSSYQQRPTVVAQDPLAAGAKVAIATPADGKLGTLVTPGSGALTASAFRDAFARHAGEVVVSTDCDTLACLREEHPEATYFVMTTIVHWEDRATEWSGRPDHVQLRVAVHDRAGAEPVTGIEIFGQSQWATMGGDHTQDLLAEPINQWVDSIY